MSRTAKARLGELSNALYSGIRNMTPRQRGAALRALDAVNDCNCGWTLYRMREVLRMFIGEASSARERAARARRARRGAP